MVNCAVIRPGAAWELCESVAVAIVEVQFLGLSYTGSVEAARLRGDELPARHLVSREFAFVLHIFLPSVPGVMDRSALK